MHADVLLQTLADRRRSLLWWSLGVAALVALTVAFYPSVRDDTAINDYVKNLPDSVRGLFVGGELDISSPAGYLNSQIYAVIAPIVFLIFAVGAGSDAVAGEEERGTLDFLLAQPLLRRDFLVQRFLAVVILVVALAVVLLAAVELSSLAVDLEISIGKLVAASVSVGLLALLFGTVALAAGSVRPGRSWAIAAAAGLAVASWLLDGLGQAVDFLEPWRKLSPFYQAVGRNPLREGALWGAWGILFAVTLVLVAVAVLGLNRRDLRQ